MIRPIITGLALATTLAAAAQDSAFSQAPDDAGAAQDGAFSQAPDDAGAAQDGAFSRFLDDAGKALDSGLRVLDEGVKEGGRAIDQTLVVPSQPPFGALASAMIGAPVLDSDGNAVAEVADLVVAPDGRVVLAVLRVGGTLGFGGTLKAADFAALETVQHDGGPAYRHRGYLEALPTYRTAGED